MNRLLMQLGAGALWSGITLGCASGPGTIALGQYQSKYEGLVVVGQGATESAGLLPAGWKLDNFYGSPMPTEAKASGDYTTTYRLDGDGNGVYELKIERYAYELRFVNLTDDGVIWLRVVPVSADLAEMALPVLVDAYVDSLSGGSFDTVWVDREHAKGRDRRYTAMLLASQPGTIGGVECQVATIDVADVDQVQLAPEKRYRKLQVLIARAPFTFSARGKTFPTYLVAGYSNQPARFDGGLPQFRDFLQRVHIRGQHGLTVPDPVQSPTESAKAPPREAAPGTPAADVVPSPVPTAEPPVAPAATIEPPR